MTFTIGSVEFSVTLNINHTQRSMRFSADYRKDGKWIPVTNRDIFKNHLEQFLWLPMSQETVIAFKRMIIDSLKEAMYANDFDVSVLTQGE